MRISNVLIAATACVAAFPAAASASTITSDGTNITYTNRGAAADVASSNTFPTTYVDAGARLNAQGSCVAGPPVTCPGFSTTATLGAGADTAKIASFGPVAISGGGGGDGIYDWAATVSVDGAGGSDLLIGDANGLATITGGAADDRVFGRGAGVDLSGDGGADLVVSDANNATLSGGNGADTLVATKNAAAGHMNGDAGSDLLTADGVPMPILGGWTFDGGAGNDVIEATGDGSTPDTVICGPGGADTAYVDASDVVGADCEYVVTGAPPAGSPVALAAAQGAAFKAAVATVHPNALTPGPLLPGL